MTGSNAAAHTDPVFEPSAEFAGRPHIGAMDTYREMYQRPIEDPDGCWVGIA